MTAFIEINKNIQSVPSKIQIFTKLLDLKVLYKSVTNLEGNNI